MPTSRSFALIDYVTLALSCTCLIQAETLLLPGMVLCLPPLLLLMAAAYLRAGRWALSEGAANLLGLVIVCSTGVWLVLQLHDEDSWVSRLPRPAGFLPLLGPVVLSLLVVQLFRPHRERDFWLVHGVGLLQVGLGCLITGDTALALLLAAYFLGALASLIRHSQARERARATPLGAPAGLVRVTLGTFLVITPLALLLFLLTPRRTVSTWHPLSGLQEPRTGLSGLTGGMLTEIDLNRTGAVSLDDEPALMVRATDLAARPRTDLSAEQRWRATVLDIYEEGLWRGTGPPYRSRTQTRLPSFGADACILRFRVRPRDAGGLVLAEPIRLGPPDCRLPVLLEWPQVQPVFCEVLGTVLPQVYERSRTYRYRQVIPGPSSQDCTAAGRLDAGYLGLLRRQEVPGLREWTLALLRRLVRDPRGDLADLSVPAVDSSATLPPEEWRRVAGALTDYLATSGEYVYTLELRRVDRTLDPALDFLKNLREGHCERYASGLALMLRALGIPARIVQGYRGAEPLIEEGAYVVRHSHAHSWVEILVPHPGGAAGELDWLTLDPTPSLEVRRPSHFSLGGWWLRLQGQVDGLWREMVVDFGSRQQARLWHLLPSPLPRYMLAAVAAVAVLALGARYLRRHWPVRAPAWGNPQDRSPSTRAAGGLYSRLQALVARHLALEHTPSQTPRELARAARDLLEGLPLAPGLMDLPERIVVLFYRVRFGGQALAEQEEQSLGHELDRLADALREAAFLPPLSQRGRSQG